jgi:hypothetical protein
VWGQSSLQLFLAGKNFYERLIHKYTSIKKFVYQKIIIREMITMEGPDMKKFITGICALSIVSFSQADGIQQLRAAKPTHYFYTPTAYVNKPFTLVASLHEISYSFPGKFQVQASLLDNIGRVDFGGKYQIIDNLSVGAGVAYNLAHIGYGKHGIMASDHAPPRFGTYLAFGLVKTSNFECALTPHIQIGRHDYGSNDFGLSTGADFGMMGTPSSWTSFIAEVGTSYDFHDHIFYFNTDGGIRIHPPTIPFMSFDGGVDIEEFPVGHDAPSVAPYIDVIFAIRTN